MSKETALILGDLHIFAKRSRGLTYWNAIPKTLTSSQATLCILLGDIFDFAWATQFEEPGQAQAEAITMLETLVNAHPETTFHYILGNHDYDDRFLTPLNELAPTLTNLQIHPAHLQIRDTLLLHGDATDLPGLDAHTLLVHRTPFRQKPTYSRLREFLYTITIFLNLDQITHFLHTPPWTTHRRLRKYLKRNKLSSVTKIIFGHTHRNLENKPYKKLTLTNPGAPIGKRPFQPLIQEI